MLHEPRRRRSWLIFDVSLRNVPSPRSFKMKRVFFAIVAVFVVTAGGYYIHLRAGMAPMPAVDHARVTEGLISLVLTQQAQGSLRLTVRNDSPVAVSYYGHATGQPVYSFEV